MAISRSQMTRQLYQGGGVSSLEQARDVLQAQALPGEFLAYINPQEAAMLKYMGGAGEPINQSGIPSFFVKKIFKGAKKAVSGAVDAVTDFAKSDIGQIALAVALPMALGPAFTAAGLGGSIGGSAFLGNALRAGITNLALQGVTTGKFNLGQAAKAGIIGGGIQTGLRNYQQTGNAFTSGDVTTGGDVLKSTVVPDAVSEVPANVPTDMGTGRFADFDMRVGAGDEQVFGITPQATTPTVPTTPTTPGQFNLEQALQGFDQSEPIGGAIGMEPIQGKFGQTTGTRFTIPTGDTEMISTIKGGVADIPLADRAGQFSTSIQDVFREGATLSERTTSAVDALKQISGAALDRPMSSIAIASLLSAASVPQQPEESDFDYEERMKIVNDFASSYGQRAGINMSGVGDIEDYESYYSQRARVAYGGSPEVPTGNVRENQAGIMELDYRDTGGRVPIGVKEKADDVPAMLSKDEFVFTSKAVKNAGNGDVDKGAEKLYKVMNILENGGTV